MADVPSFKWAYNFLGACPGRLQVARLEELASWRLLLVDWGFNTAKERERARENARISVVGIDEFRALIQGK
jgi:hypothetical protein